MEIVHTVRRMREIADESCARGKVTGLVPTMGALHAGHFSLVRAAQAESSRVVVSIFVNPKQFWPNEDFENYPRSFEKDVVALESLGVDHVFAPSVGEMYPAGFSTAVSLEGLSERLEGRSRPGHFHGVATVVLKLFEIVRPSFAYFGRKDAQQLRIIEQMTKDLNLGVRIVPCAIVREPDGLALSSRNACLNPRERQAATALYRALDRARRRVSQGEVNTKQLIQDVEQTIGEEDTASLEYAEIVETSDFLPAEQLRNSCLLLIAAIVGCTRLIDNALIERKEGSFQVTL